MDCTFHDRPNLAREQHGLTRSVSTPLDSDAPYAIARADMVQEQLIPRGIRDPRVLEAMRTIPRHAFVPKSERVRAYDDCPLPVELEQTISQPYMVAIMTEHLAPQPTDTILEVGTGSGYQTAILATLGGFVHTIERHRPLAQHAQCIFDELTIQNVKVHVGDGTNGLKAFAPFDRIIVTAGAPRVPQELVNQLTVGGSLVCPVGSRDEQELVVIHRDANGVREERGISCRFVPLIGNDGWTP